MSSSGCSVPGIFACFWDPRLDTGYCMQQCAGWGRGWGRGRGQPQVEGSRVGRSTGVKATHLAGFKLQEVDGEVDDQEEG